MQIDIALLLPIETQNQIRKLILNLHLKEGLSLEATLLPQHISLKSAFIIDKMETIEPYFDNLAKTITPLTLELSTIELVNFEKQEGSNVLLWINVSENQQLKDWHHLICNDFKNLGIPLSPFDGEGFNFHSTLFYRSDDSVPMEQYENAFRTIQEKELSISCTPSKIALFCATRPGKNPFLSSFTYKILPLGR